MQEFRRSLLIEGKDAQLDRPYCFKKRLVSSSTVTAGFGSCTRLLTQERRPPAFCFCAVARPRSFNRHSCCIPDPGISSGRYAPAPGESVGSSVLAFMSPSMNRADVCGAAPFRMYTVAAEQPLNAEACRAADGNRLDTSIRRDIEFFGRSTVFTAAETKAFHTGAGDVSPVTLRFPKGVWSSFPAYTTATRPGTPPRTTRR